MTNLGDKVNPHISYDKMNGVTVLIPLTKKRKILVWSLAALLAAYSLFGFFAVPLIVSHMLTTRAAGALDRPITLTRAAFNPYSLTLRLNGLAVEEKDRSPFVSLDELRVNVQLRSLFQRALVIREIHLAAPRLHLERLADQSFNFSDLLKPGNGKAGQKHGSSPRIIVEALLLEQGRIHFRDDSVAPVFEAGLKILALQLTGLDTRPGSPPARMELEAVGDTGETFSAEALVGIEPLDLQADLGLAGVAPANYAPYYQSFLKAMTVEQGRIGVKARLAWSSTVRRISAIGLTITDLSLKDAVRGKSLLFLPGLEATGAAVDLGDRSMELGSITARDGRVDLERDARGDLNLPAALSTQPGSPPPAGGESSRPWLITLEQLTMSGFRIGYTDQQPARPANLALEDVALAAKKLSTSPDSKGQIEIALRWADAGKVKIGGDLGLVPLQADLQVEADSLDLRPAQPYIDELARLMVTSGRLQTRGRLSMVQSEKRPFGLRYTGQAALTDFNGIDADKAAAFLSFKSLFLNDIALDTAAPELLIGDVALTDFYNRLIIAADGTSNVGDIFGARGGPGKATAEKDAPPASPPPEPARAPSPAYSIKVKTVTLQGGRLDFSDLSVKPNVHLPMQALGGRISGLDNIRENKADVLLQGKLSGDVPLEITGQINPLVAQPFVDLKLSLKGIDMSPLTPYSGKYLGYALEKGQLTLGLDYLLDQNKLKGRNQVYLHRLTLGDSVPSPEATKLPIKLAIALLKDRNGDIKLDLPVQGNLDDPEFSIGGLVVKMFVNLIVKIVSSPFQMLGALFGGGEELAYLEFEPGQALIAPENQEKLDKLAKILFERPALNLEIQGQADPRDDAEGLRRLRFDRQLGTVKLKQMMARGEKAVPLEQITVSEQEREGLIRAAFDAADFPKPRDSTGALKKLTVEEMEKLLFTAIAVSRDDLRQLAYQRANLAKDRLHAGDDVDPSRLFVVEPEIAAQGAKGEKRVKFSFK